MGYRDAKDYSDGNETDYGKDCDGAVLRKWR